MGKYFGTDGFRGEANVTLTAEQAYKIGRYLGYLYGDGHRCRIAIGKDTRRSSYMYEYALCAGICASGADAYLLHVTTTPSVSYAVRSEGFDLGIMISASHNPYYDNGIKLIGGRGEKLSDGVTAELEEYLDGRLPDPPLAKGADIGRTVDYAEGRNRYTGYLISLARNSYRGMRVGLDAANGSAWMLAKSVFDALGAVTYVIGNSPNGLNINDGVGSTHIEALCRLVVAQELDIGFAFDGDADRCLAVDEGGRVISGDNILYFAARYMRECGELSGNTVVATVMSNLGLFKALEREGIDYILTDVGDRYVYEAISRGGYSLGGEESGHIIFSKYSATGDGLITAIKIMEMLIASKLPASRLSDGFVRYPQITVSVRVKDKDAVLSNPEVIRARERAEAALSPDGRLLLRKSGTEPVLRIMAEAKTEELCRRVVNELAEVIGLV